MATQIPVGKARLFPVTFSGVPGGTVPTTSVGNELSIRATINPDNPNEMAVVALAVSAGVNARAHVPGATATHLIEVTDAPPPPETPSISIGEPGPVIDPPSWA